jgi:hypothetical protein
MDAAFVVVLLIPMVETCLMVTLNDDANFEVDPSRVKSKDARRSLKALFVTMTLRALSVFLLRSIVASDFCGKEKGSERREVQTGETRIPSETGFCPPTHSLRQP